MNSSALSNIYERKVIPINGGVEKRYYTPIEDSDITFIDDTYNYKAYQTAVDMVKYNKSKSTSIKTDILLHNSSEDIINNKNKDSLDYVTVSNDINLDKEGKSVMNEYNYLEKYITKLEEDRREQEERLSKNMNHMEQRITEERRLSEERIEKKFIEAMQSLEKTNNKIDSINDKIDNKIDSINDKIDGTNKWMMGTCIATILAVAAIAASVWFK